MIRALADRLTFSNVIACIALFVALGGGAYAISKNSVKSRHIVDGQVKSSDLRDDGVKAIDIEDGAIGPAEIQPAGLSGDEIDESTLSGLGAGSFDALPHAVLIATAEQTFGNNFHDTVDMDTVVSQADLSFNDATDRLTFNTPGVYAASGWINWQSNAAGVRQLDFRKNFSEGAIFHGGNTKLPAALTADQQSTTWMERFDSGDTIELAAVQNSGGNLGTGLAAGRRASLSVHWLGP